MILSCHDSVGPSWPGAPIRFLGAAAPP